MLRWTVTLGFAGALALGVTGCSTNVERIDANAPPATVASTPASSASPPPAAPERPAGPAEVLAPPRPADGAAAGGAHEERLKAVQTLELAHEKSPGDAGALAKLIAAKTEYGVKLMEDGTVPPMMKYRPALKAFKEVLALDPGNKEASARKAVIEDIYRSMGRPVPE